MRFAERKGCDLSDISLTELQNFSALIAQDVYQVLSLEGSLSSRDHIGGTAPKQVNAAIAGGRNHLSR